MTEQVLLTGRASCKPRHLLYRVVETPDMLIIDAPRWCAGREANTWRADQRQLDPLNNRVTRYGCACRRSGLVADVDLSGVTFGVA